MQKAGFAGFLLLGRTNPFLANPGTRSKACVKLLFANINTNENDPHLIEYVTADNAQPCSTQRSAAVLATASGLLWYAHRSLSVQLPLQRFGPGSHHPHHTIHGGHLGNNKRNARQQHAANHPVHRPPI